MSVTSVSAQPQYVDGPRAVRGGIPSPYPEQVIGSYVMGETVGRGSFGKVKRGRHIHTGEPVAIKILNRQKLKSANMDKKIHREIEILQLFSHPNICRLYEVISTPTDMYLIMEFIEGGELYDYIVQKGRVREPEARYIFQQIVCALEYCHHFRVVHRDLKPENILLGPGLQVKLIDFGLSNIMKDGEFLTTSCGSPNYAAPEVISGKLYFGPEVDVWSCGVIFYALLCGCLPFDEDSIPVLFSKIKKGKYSIPSSMPTGPRALIQQVLLVDPLVRLTIPQIRDNPWFNQKLPMRLSFTESLFAVQEDRIISSLASETAKKLGMREKDVRRELERGAGPSYVAYNILLDARRRKEIAVEVRELGVAEDGGSSAVSGSPVASNAAAAAQQQQQQQQRLASPEFQEQLEFVPKAMERELNMGLMLSPSPAMESMLEQNDASANKLAYNSGTFVPASAQIEPRGFGTTPAFPGPFGESIAMSAPTAPGAFSMRRRTSGLTGAGSHEANMSPESWRGPGSLGGSNRRPTGIGSSASQLGASFGDNPRVGSVARKHAMYTIEEEQFLVENNYGWRIGLMTDWQAERAFQTVYSVLKAYGMQWKVLSPFRVLARSTDATWLAMDQQDHGAGSNSSRGSRSSRPRGTGASSSPIPIGGGGPMSSAAIPIGGGGGGASRGFGGGSGGFYGGSAGPDGYGSRPSSPLGMPSGGSSSRYTIDDTPLPVDELPHSVPPAEDTVVCLHLFRIHERHDKGFLVDFSILRNAMVGLDVVCRLSDELIRRVD